MLFYRVVALAIIAALCVPAQGRKKKKEEKEVTQELEVLKDPPHALIADASRLTFYVTPLSSKGLLSQQVRDGLKSLFNQARNSQFARIRAFVAGSGDLRRVQAIVSEEFTDKRLSLPTLSVVQVGALPLEGAQVALEAIAIDRKPQNPSGLAFIAGQPATAKDGVALLRKAVESTGASPENVRKVTCFLDSLDNLNNVRTEMATAFPKAAGAYVQLRRDSIGDFVECEAVAALTSPPGKPLQLIGSIADRYSQAALVGPGKVVLTGTQMAFGREEGDVRLAFGRLVKALDGVGVSPKSVAMTSVYPLTRNVADHVRKVRFEYFDRTQPPASTLLFFEGLPSLDATFAIDVVAAAQ